MEQLCRGEVVNPRVLVVIHSRIALSRIYWYVCADVIHTGRKKNNSSPERFEHTTDNAIASRSHCTAPPTPRTFSGYAEKNKILLARRCRRYVRYISTQKSIYIPVYLARVRMCARVFRTIRRRRKQSEFCGRPRRPDDVEMPISIIAERVKRSKAAPL